MRKTIKIRDKMIRRIKDNALNSIKEKEKRKKYKENVQEKDAWKNTKK